MSQPSPQPEPARSPVVPISQLSLVQAMSLRVPQMIRACTPSVLPQQELPEDIRTSDISVSFEALGSPVSGTDTFAAINATVAEFYGARRAWSLVNGSTGANWVIARWLSYRLGPDETVLIGRGSHVSVPQALTDFRVKWEYLEPDYVPEYEAVLPPSAAAVSAAIIGRDDVAAVWLNGPSYEGVVLDAKGIHEALGGDQRTILMIVDEAWGSHFPAHPATAGWSAIAHADVLNTSTHKQAGGLQGTAVLVTSHTPRVTDAEIAGSVRSMSTTSPSYLLLASIESVYRILVAERSDGCASASSLLAYAERLRWRVAQRMADLELGDFADHVSDTTPGVDPLKVTFGVRSLVKTGIELGAILMDDDVIVEKASLNAITFLVTYQMCADDVIDQLAERFEHAVRSSGGAAPGPRELLANPFAMTPTTATLTPADAARRAVHDEELVELRSSVGRVSAERLAAYPPGVPVIIEGQVITDEQIDFIETVVGAGGHLLANRSGGQVDHHSPVMINVLR